MLHITMNASVHHFNSRPREQPQTAVSVCAEMRPYVHEVEMIREEYFRIPSYLRRGVRLLYVEDSRPDCYGYYDPSSMEIAICGIQHCGACVRNTLYHELGHHEANMLPRSGDPEWIGHAIKHGMNLSALTRHCHREMADGLMNRESFASEVWAELFVGRYGAHPCHDDGYSWPVFGRLLAQWNSLFGRD